MSEEESLQIENGNFTRLHNRILEELSRVQLSGHEVRIVFALWRQTYGWQKKENVISLSQFSKITGLNKVRVSEAIRSLKTKNLITENRNGNSVTYCFNKYFTTWKPLRKTVTLTENRNHHYGKPESPLRKTVTKKRVSTKGDNELQTPKEITTKKITTKKKNVDDFRLAKLLSDLMTDNNPNRKPTSKKDIEKWSDTCRLMREQDKRTVKDIEVHIRFSQQDDFWFGYILSMKKLRIKYDQLTLKMKKTKTSVGSLDALQEFYQEQKEKEVSVGA